MTPNDQSTSRLKDRASLYIYIASLYFVMVAVLYLWGYWSEFRINILDYAGFADVLRLALYPVASTFAFFVVGALISHFGPTAKALPRGGGRDTRLGVVLNRNKQWLSAVYGLATLALWVFGPAQKWRILPALVAMPIAIVVNERGLFPSFWLDERARSTTLFLVAALPFWAYGQGKMRAADVTSGSAYDYLVANTIDNVKIGDASSPKNRVKYLGQINEYVFLLLPDGSWAVARFDRTQGLQLRHHFGAEEKSASSGPGQQK